MWPNKEILFEKLVDQFYFLKITFENRTKVRMIHFKVSVGVNAAEIISFLYFFKKSNNENLKNACPVLREIYIANY